jgi:hypothetical protein
LSVAVSVETVPAVTVVGLAPTVPAVTVQGGVLVFVPVSEPQANCRSATAVAAAEQIKVRRRNATGDRFATNRNRMMAPPVPQRSAHDGVVADSLLPAEPDDKRASDGA